MEGICSTKNIQIQEGSTELCMCENRFFCIPVNTLTVWHAGFLDTLLCVLNLDMNHGLLWHIALIYTVPPQSSVYC